MTRLPKWQSRLTDYISEVSRAPFVEGQNDCALFLAGGVLAITGQDFAAPYRGRYTTIRGGLRILRRDGFKDHIALAEHHLKRISTAFAKPGDGAVMDTPEGFVLGIVQGHSVYIRMPKAHGLLPLTDAVFALEV